MAMTLESAAKRVWAALLKAVDFFGEEIFTYPNIATDCDKISYRLFRRVALEGAVILMEPSRDEYAVRITLCGQTEYVVSDSLNVAIAEACSGILLKVDKAKPGRLR